jgi:hypothetical protein
VRACMHVWTLACMHVCVTGGGLACVHAFMHTTTVPCVCVCVCVCVCACCVCARACARHMYVCVHAPVQKWGLYHAWRCVSVNYTVSFACSWLVQARCFQRYYDKLKRNFNAGLIGIYISYSINASRSCSPDLVHYSLSCLLFICTPGRAGSAYGWFSANHP